MTDHDDTEALTRVLAMDGWLGHADELEMFDLRNIADTIVASDWLAAYVARKVEAVERERDEALAVIERVTAALHQGGQTPSIRARAAMVALAEAAKPASCRLLTLDEHLAEVERRIYDGMDGLEYNPDEVARDIVRTYREEVRRG